jgi:hypothetical protein
MKHLKKFDELSFYNKDLVSILPNDLTIIKGDKKITYHKGEIMKNASMIQITYTNSDIWGEPETLELDFYIIDHTKYTKINMDITHGDEVVCSFSIIPPNTVSQGLSTSYGSKFDPSNTIFAFDDRSLNGIVGFFNNLKVGFELSTDDFTFLKG